MTARRRASYRRRRFAVFVLVIGLIAVIAYALHSRPGGPTISPLRAKIVSVAESQLGYRTDPPDSYCNRFSAYWDAGQDECGSGLLSEEWCADFAAWVWQQAGAVVHYELAPGYLNSNSASFYVWGVDHGTWHPIGSDYTPQPGDVAIYGLDTSAVTADHVAVVTSATRNRSAPNVINGDGDRTGFSVVEVGHRQVFADAKGAAGRISGYVSPTAPPSGGS